MDEDRETLLETCSDMIDSDLAIIVARHRVLMRSWALLVGAHAVLIALSVLGSEAFGNAHWPYVWRVLGALTLGSPPVLAVLACRVLASTGMPSIPAALASIGVLIPVLGPLIIAPMIAGDAKHCLRERFVRVPLLGVSKRDAARVLRPSLCRRCGYDLQGLKDRRCPECGRTQSEAAE